MTLVQVLGSSERTGLECSCMDVLEGYVSADGIVSGNEVDEIDMLSPVDAYALLSICNIAPTAKTRISVVMIFNIKWV